MLFLYLGPQILHNGHGGLDAQVAHNQGFFYLLIEIVINGGKSAEDGINSRYDIVAGLGKPFYQPSEKPLFSLSHNLYSLSVISIYQ